jgi:hypothetical protein
LGLKLLRPSPFYVTLALASLACRAFLGNGVAQPGEVLFQDDFSNPSSGWNRASTEVGETDYADGMYRIFVNQTYMDVWSKPGLAFTDVRIEVDAIKVSGDRDNRFGVICRAIQPGSFYTFIISSDGYYGIGRINGEEFTLIGMDAMQPSDAIHQGSAYNRIRADCIADRLALYVNERKLAEVSDDQFKSGDVGLIAGTYDIAGTDVRFDNYTVYQP